MSKFTKKEREILSVCFDEMGNVFTSQEFYFYIRELGMTVESDDPQKSMDIRNYLLKYADINTKGGKTWTKKQPSIDTKNVKPVEQVQHSLDIESCIKFLKSKGYKVLQPYTEFQEV